MFPRIKVPQNGWFIMETPIPTPTFGNTHLNYWTFHVPLAVARGVRNFCCSVAKKVARVPCPFAVGGKMELLPIAPVGCSTVARGVVGTLHREPRPARVSWSWQSWYTMHICWKAKRCQTDAFLIMFVQHALSERRGFLRLIPENAHDVSNLASILKVEPPRNAS